MEEAAIARRGVKGLSRQEKVAELFDRHYGSLRGLAVAILGNVSLAEEAVMEAFVKLYSKWGRIEKLDYPPAYLRQIVVNQCRSQLRRSKLEERSLGLLQRPGAVSDSSARSDATLDLWTEVLGLPERQRVCVALFYIEDMSEADIAEVMECSVGTVKSQLAKARRKLEPSYAKEEAGDE